MIVDDEEDIRDSLRDVFEDEGYIVASAVNGHKGLEHLRSQRAPCVIILDLMMPVMSGVELYSLVKSESALASIPIIISTSDPSQAPEGSLIMQKPIDLDVMLATVASMCRLKHGPAGS